MTETPQASTAARLVSYLAVVVAIFVLIGLSLAGIIAFQLIAGGSGSGDSFAFLFVTTWLLLLGVISIVVGSVGMVIARGAPAERKRCWYAIALGLVALAIGATFGVGFV